MARVTEHKVDRTIYNHNNESNPNHPIINYLIDAENINILDLISTPCITNDITHKNATDKKNLCKKYRDSFLNRYENIKQNLSSNPIASEYYSQTFHKKLPFKDTKTLLPSLSVIDMEIFLADNLQFSLTCENKINEYFDISLINDNNGELKISTFKDNTQNSCSDKIILFNLSMILVINEITSTPLSFSILNEPLNCSFSEKHCSTFESTLENNTHRLFSVFNSLSKIEFKEIRYLFSEECIHFFLSYIVCYPKIYISILNTMKEYLRQERKFVLDLCRNEHFEFLVIFLPYLGVEVKSPSDITQKMIKCFYKVEIEKYIKLISDINSTSNALWGKYCRELPNLIQERKLKNDLDEIFTVQKEIQETANNILHYFDISNLNNSSLQFLNYLTILTNLSSTNDVKQFIELFYNICVTKLDNISVLSQEIFFHNYAFHSYEYNPESKDNLYDILNKCHCSLLCAEVLAGLLSILICDENDWCFIYSVLSSQTNDPIWYRNYFEIVKLIRGSNYVIFDEIKARFKLYLTCVPI